jgi:uncharacterized membrane protein YdbT with pleckstrin-like domain
VSYVDSQLLSGETVVYRAHLHKVLFLTPVIFSVLAVLMVAGSEASGAPGLWPVIGLWFIVTAFTSVWAWINYITSEFAVTNKRVIIKVGWLRRRSLETMLSKIEGIAVDQGILGRILDFGTISVTGTGGTREAFMRIAAPLEFRRQVQDVVSRLEDSRAAVNAPAGAYALPARDERECPFCAERILVKAKICKHCGREVASLPV